MRELDERHNRLIAHNRLEQEMRKAEMERILSRPIPDFNLKPNPQPQKKEGCYIATMVYGDYNAPEVKVLRNFRDTSLKATWIGRSFISVYYWLSPKFVRIFKNNKAVNTTIKKILDSLVDRLK